MTMQVLGTLLTIFSHVDGWLAGARMGYNYQVDRLVLGAELAGSITGMKDNGQVMSIWDLAAVRHLIARQTLT